MLHAWVAYKSGDAAAAAERWRALVAQDARFGDADWLMQELDFSALEDETTRGILQHITPDTPA
ncbi:MAG: hypothetical protein SF123_03870 [Chloroflexota bacterium]|nr:hypothetical protein [Chloroflexota bacterium]